MPTYRSAQQQLPAPQAASTASLPGAVHHRCTPSWWREIRPRADRSWEQWEKKILALYFLRETKGLQNRKLKTAALLFNQDCQKSRSQPPFSVRILPLRTFLSLPAYVIGQQCPLDCALINQSITDRRSCRNKGIYFLIVRYFIHEQTIAIALSRLRFLPGSTHAFPPNGYQQ